MRNQTSFRLTTTLLPTDTTANTTTVINKLDSSGNKFYPTFTEETVVLTNDDRTIMETTRATCNNGVLTFVKRGLSDDASATPIDNRKLTWNPGTLCFITAGAGDWIDKDDNITWTGNQTYTGNLVSQGNATYNGLLTTNKGVKYPSFANVEALNAYANPFGGMFATVDSTGELYRYNAVTEERALIESSQPANPEMADDETIGTVRVATNAEFAAGTDTGSHGEYLVATPSQIQSVSPSVNVDIYPLNSTTDTTNAQIILNKFLAGGCPVISFAKYGVSDPERWIFYYYNSTTGIVRFRQNMYSATGTDSGGTFLQFYRLAITYSGTTVSSISLSSDKVYVNSIVEE